MNRIVWTAVVVAVLGVLLAAASRGSDGAARSGEPIVTVTRQGGLCYPGAECRTTLRIGDATITGEGYRPRRLTPGERRALLHAIGKLDVAYLRAHPFKGLCPTAYDGPETTYRFRGFPRRLPGCTYDLRGVEAVRLTEKLLTTLRPAR